MAEEEIMAEGELISPNEVEVPAPIAEEALDEAAEEEVVTTTLSHTIDELPELADKTVGDTIPLRITNISEDGKTYSMEVVEEVPVAEETALPAAGGREAIAEAFLG